MLASEVNKFELEITSNCNAECPLCARTEMGMPLRGNTEISLDTIKRVWATKDDIQGKEFKLCGVLGDPIVHPQCLEICEWFGNNGGKVVISTNGGYNNEEWWTKLAQIDNIVVDFCVDGYEKTNHIYRVNVNWKTLVRNMTAYTENGGNARWVFIPFSHNEDDYENAKALAEKLGMRFVRRTSGRNELNKNRKHKPRKAEEVKLAGSDKLPHNDLTELKQLIKEKDTTKIDEIVPTLSCQHLEEPELFVASNSTVWPCCYLFDESLKGYETVTLTQDKTFNSLNEFTIDEILQKDLYKSLKQRWYASHDNHLPRCIKSCGLKGVYKNKREYV